MACGVGSCGLQRGSPLGVRVPSHEQHETAGRPWPGPGEGRVPGAAECGLLGLPVCLLLTERGPREASQEPAGLLREPTYLP